MKTLPTQLILLIALFLCLFILSMPFGSISLSNIEIDKTGKNLCRYTIQRMNNNLKDKSVKILINLVSGSGQKENFNWVDDTLQTEDPRLDYLLSPKCPIYVEKDGVKTMTYSVFNGSGTKIAGGSFNVSTKFVDRTK